MNKLSHFFAGKTTRYAGAVALAMAMLFGMGVSSAEAKNRPRRVTAVRYYNPYPASSAAYYNPNPYYAPAYSPAPYDPYYGDYNYNPWGKGKQTAVVLGSTGGGAVVGGLVAGKKGAIIGAIAGAVTGAVIVHHHNSKYNNPYYPY